MPCITDPLVFVQQHFSRWWQFRDVPGFRRLCKVGIAVMRESRPRRPMGWRMV